VVTALPAPKNPRHPYGAYWQQYVYRCPQVACRNAIVHPYTLPAISVIDRAKPGSRIGDRREPLAPKTMARIAAGLARYAPRARVGQADAVPSLLVPVEARVGLEARPASRPMRVQTGRNETALLVPAGGTWNDEASPASAPMRTRTTRETEAVAMIPLRNNNRPKALAEPLDTFAAEGNHHGLASVPGPRRSVEDGAEDAAGWRPGHLFAYDTGAFRALGRQPLPTQTTVEGDALVESAIAVEDCLFRMLLPAEIKLGMAFAREFRLLGTKREQVRMCGNAVTPPVARDLIAALVEAITGDEVCSA
jgi:DNA (cytosine-5)-methyltransferase 1